MTLIVNKIVDLGSNNNCWRGEAEGEIPTDYSRYVFFLSPINVNVDNSLRSVDT